MRKSDKIWNYRDLQYYVLTGKDHSVKESSIYNLTLDFWRKEWTKIFKAINPNHELNNSDFHCQNKISVLLKNNTVVALQTLSHHHLGTLLEQSYFSPYTIGFFQGLKAMNVAKFQSMQHYIVGSEYRPLKTGLNLAAILAGLGFFQQRFFNLEATITLARKDNSSHSIATNFGMEQLHEDIEMHNVPVGQMYTLKACEYPKAKVQEATEYLWRNRTIDFEIISEQGGSTYVA